MNVSTVRQTIAARIAALSTTYPGLVESQEPYAFVRSPERSPVHLEFAVDLVTTTPDLTPQHPTEGAMAMHEARVVVAYHLPDKDKVAGLDAATDLEQAIRTQLLADGWTHTGSTPVAAANAFSALTWRSSTHTAGIYGWLWYESTYVLFHLVPIS